MSTTPRPAAPRSLADDLRRRSDDELIVLLTERADLLRPAPSDLTTLAARATTRAGVVRALERLDLAHLTVLAALSGAGADPTAAAARLGTAPAALAGRMARLHGLALVWGEPDAPQVPRAVTETLADLAVPLPPTDPTPPTAASDPHDAARVDQAAGARAAELLELLDELGAAWGADPPRVLRSGGLAVRDLARSAARLGVDEPRAARLAELAFGAGLIADDGDVDPAWCPTEAFDAWRVAPAGLRWAAVTRPWMHSHRAPHRIGHRRAESTGSINALSDAVAWPAIRGVRELTLQVLAELPPGSSMSAADLAAVVAWRRPLWPGAPTRAAIDAVLTEAEESGITAQGALTTPGRRLVQGGDAPEAMDSALPPPVERLMLQSDLTAVAPGRLEGPIAALLRDSAVRQSRGGAAVFRFDADSIRAALDAGRTAPDLLADLGAAAGESGVPQPLAYLIGDVARRHGAVRVGGAGAYLRSDDTAALDALAARPELARLRLRRIAPTVLVSAGGPAALVAALRTAGVFPVAEGADGLALPTGPPPHRADDRRAARPTEVVFDAAEAARRIVPALRSAEERRHQTDDRAGAVPPADPAVTLAILRDAVADRAPVWLGVVDAAGVPRRVLFHPDRLDGGRVHGRQAGRDAPSAYPLHRLTGAEPTG